MQWDQTKTAKAPEDETFSEMQMRHAVEMAKKVEQLAKQSYDDGLEASPFNPNQDVRTRAVTDIVHLVGVRHQVTIEEMRGFSKIRKIIRARQEAYCVLRDRGMTLQAIGDYFKRDHTTVMSGITRHQGRAK